MATVKKIYLKKDRQWNSVEKIDLNDLQLKKSKRDVSFISSKGNKRLIDDHNKGFCHVRFKANFIVSNININNLVVDQKLQIGQAIIKVTEIEKECLSNCPIVKDFNKTCAVNKEIFFGEVIRGGIIKKGDDIFFV